MRYDTLTSKMRQGNSLCFRKDIRRRFGESKRKLAQNVDGVSGETKVANFSKQKYSDILNSVEYSRDKRAFISNLDGLPKKKFFFYSWRNILID